MKEAVNINIMYVLGRKCGEGWHVAGNIML
jgi:hypothetical protein